MAGKLLSMSIAAPGFLGLNSQESGVTLSSGYATRAYNCIIDRYGRLGSRRGWEFVTEDNDDLGSTNTIESIFEFKKVTGDITYLSSGDGKIFSGTSTLTELPIYDNDETTVLSVTFTGNTWQWAALPLGSGASASSTGFAAQRGNTLLAYRKKTSTNDYILQQVGIDYGSAPAGLTVFDPNCVLSAFGRVWTAGVSENKTTIFYSQLLNGAAFTGTGSGLLDIGSVIGNNDEIVALAAHNSYLIVFCKNNIVVYGNADNPTTISIADVVTGIGCISRDTVQSTGTDLVFLSRSGVRSFRRTVEEKSMPLRELSLNIRDELVDYINGETVENIKGAYFERDAFYLLTLPNMKHIVCFDMRTPLENGASRVTLWDNVEYKAFCQTEDRNLYLGVEGGIGRYFGYSDNGQPYRIEYFTAPTDLEEGTLLKILKKIAVTVIGSGQQDFTVKYAFDYSNTYNSRNFSKDLGAVPSYYNISEYGVGEYTSGVSINTILVHAGGTGKVVQFGVEAIIDNAPVSIQKMDMYLIRGRTI